MKRRHKFDIEKMTALGMEAVWIDLAERKVWFFFSGFIESGGAKGRLES